MLLQHTQAFHKGNRCNLKYSDLKKEYTGIYHLRRFFLEKSHKDDFILKQMREIFFSHLLCGVVLFLQTCTFSDDQLMTAFMNHTGAH